MESMITQAVVAVGGLEESGFADTAPDLRRGSSMRIGTWNLAGRWSDRHLAILTAADCDVWLLTEVNDRLAIPDYTGHVTETPMRPKVSWAGIFSRTPLEPLADPNPASAMVRIGDTTFVCSILPWRGTGDVEPWHGDNHAARTRHALDTLLEAMPGGDLCSGGDWNHALSGREYAGSKSGREAVARTVAHLDLAVATADLPQVLDGLLSIDHIAVPKTWRVDSAARTSVEAGDERLSDHDLYVVEIDACGRVSSTR
jgi:hypothetical protein